MNTSRSLRPLAVLAVIGAQLLILRVPVHGQAARPSIRLAFVHSGKIWILHEPSGRKVRLPIGGNNSSPRWTSNGRALLFRQVRGTRNDTYRWQSGHDIEQVPTASGRRTDPRLPSRIQYLGADSPYGSREAVELCASLRPSQALFGSPSPGRRMGPGW